MKTFKVAATMIVRPYLTVQAESKEDVEAVLNEQKFNKQEFLETGFPISHIEVDGIYEEDGKEVKDSVEVKCPKCGEINSEFDWHGYHYECINCGLSYDMTVCDSCEATIGYHFGDDGICPECGEPYTKEEI